MKRISPWIAVGFVSFAASSGTYACGGDDNDNGGKGGTGTILEGGAGTGGSAGDSGSFDTRLGKRCARDEDCGEEGLTCLTANSTVWSGQGPAQGYCSAPCEETDGGNPCGKFGPDALCLELGTEAAPAPYCVRGCTFGPDDLTAFDPEKCSGRREVVCAPLFLQTNTSCTVATELEDCGRGALCDQGICWQIEPACLPQCNSNADCGAGLFCDPSTGTCSATQKTGKPVGAACTPPEGDAPDECQGRCISLVDDDGNELASLCSAACTIGAPATCGWNGTTAQKAEAACILSSPIVQDNGGPGFGDRGSCLRLCDCNADCLNPDFVCVGNANVKRGWNRAGTCDLRVGLDGGTITGIPTCAADSGAPPSDGGPKDAGPG